MFLEIAIFIACCVLGYGIYKISTLNTMVNFLSSENEKATDKINILEISNLSNIKQIQLLESENLYLKDQLENRQKSQTEAFASAKAALFDLGGTLSKQLLELHKQESKEIRENSEQKIHNTTQKFHLEFERLVQMISSLNQDVNNSKTTVDIIKQSLLSPSGAGQLAEITLENILKSSGLKQGVDFVTQHSFDKSENAKIRPDAIVFLPGNNIMVIDAKASKFLVEIGQEEDARLIKAMNNHTRSLASKEYTDTIITSYNLQHKTVNHVMMLMFLPTEYAVDRVTNIDTNFISRAWDSNIFPVGPSGLMNMLSFAKFQINDNIRTENHKLIIEEMRKIMSSIVTLTDYSHKMGNSVQTMVNNYDKFSASFNRNFLPKVRALQKLGIEIPNKASISTLTRYQLVSSKSELIDVEPIDVIENSDDSDQDEKN